MMPSYIYISIELKMELFPFTSANEAKVVSVLNIFTNISKVERVFAFNTKYGLTILSLHLYSHPTYRWPYVMLNAYTLSTLVVLSILISMETTFAPFGDANG